MDLLAPAKAGSYAAHVAGCRACGDCGPDVKNVTGCAHPSPWALWMGSLTARVVVVGQDFAGAASGRLEPDLTLQTNVNIRKFVRAAGLDERADVYLTNAILCLKPGDMSDKVRPAWVRNCAPRLRRTIDTVGPRAVAALGGVAWRGLGLAYKSAGIRLPALSDAVGRGPVLVPGGPALFAFNHCGGLGLVRRRFADQEDDWRRLGAWLAADGLSAPRQKPAA